MSRGNPEVEVVLEEKLPYASLPFALRELFIRGHYSCVVAGTHGKTSTSALLAWVLDQAGRDPCFFIGGIPENFGRGYRLGKGEVFVSEGDEYDSAFFDKGSKFLHYLPDLVILNNVEFDHADIFRDYADVAVAFRRLINIIPRNGFLVACWDDANVRELSEHAFSNLIRFGLQEDLGTVLTPLFGLHNVRNTLAVIAAGKELGLSLTEIREGIAGFKNVHRRMQYLGEAGGVKVFDDFAHHPTAVKLTIQGLQQRYPGKTVWALFQPRTAASKRKMFEQGYVDALACADRVVVTPLYMPEKVPQEERLSVEALSQQLHKRDVPNWILPAGDEMTDFLAKELKTGDVVLFMSNGDFQQVPKKLLNIL
jgi:UDP-N-acetylmuramate: L-alanyl-gamma-D-glutamyl-meso-diaminopimelate ligase